VTICRDNDDIRVLSGTENCEKAYAMNRGMIYLPESAIEIYIICRIDRGIIALLKTF
jgi:hypothetical protein